LPDRDPEDGPSLFDLPLSPQGARPRPPAARQPSEERAAGRRSSRGLPLFDGESEGGPEAEAPGEETPGEETPEPTAPLAAAAGDWQDLETPELPPQDDEASPEPRRPVAASVLNRLSAALLDGGLLLVVAATAIVGAYLLGVRWEVADLAPLGVFLAAFSFVYAVVPLAFWGRTPGMALVRILARGSDGGPLTFGQTALRWFGGVLTLALAGLPLLLALPALGGRSLADRLSGTRTWLLPGG
jgi:hypothetical protein